MKALSNYFDTLLLHSYTLTVRVTLNHIHKKNYSLETCARLLFMLLLDFCSSVRSRRVLKKCFTEDKKNYSYYLKLNNIIAQKRKAVSSMIDFAYLT